VALQPVQPVITMDEITPLLADLRPNWDRMRACLTYIYDHPGATKTEILRETGSRRSFAGGDPVARLAGRGLVYNLGRDNRHSWYVWQPPERPDGMWSPGHP